MVNNVVVSRVRPQLVRKRTIVPSPKTVKVVVQPSQAKAASLQQVKQTRIGVGGQRQIKQTPPPPPPNAAVSQKGLRKQRSLRKTQVKYITANVNAASIAKTQSLWNTGKGKLLIIVGNGPSISEAPLEKLKNKPKIDTLSINKPDERLWPTTHWAFFDGSQIRRHETLWSGYNGNIFNSTAIKKQKQNSMQFKNIGGRGFSRDASKGIHIGRSSVYAAMQIGMWMNYEQVYIFGCDMDPGGINGKLHFYGDNPDVDPEIRKKRFKDEATHYDNAASILTPEERSLFTFCSLGVNPWPFLKLFSTLRHMEAVDEILEHASKL